MEKKHSKAEMEEEHRMGSGGGGNSVQDSGVAEEDNGFSFSSCQPSLNSKLSPEF